MAAPTRFTFRRLLQLRIRTLLILIGVIALGLGWYVSPWEKRRRLVASIESRDLSVMYRFRDETPPPETFLRSILPKAYLDPVVGLHGLRKATDRDLADFGKAGKGVRYVGIFGCPITDAGVRFLAPLESLKSLNVQTTPITSESLLTIGSLQKLDNLNIAGTQVSDRNMERLTSLALTNLRLEKTKVTNEGIATIGAITSLESLSVGGPESEVTGDSLKHLANCTRLEELWLDHVPISDGDFDVLERLQALKKMDVRGCKIPESEFVKLTLLPRLEVLVYRIFSRTALDMKR